MNEANVQVLLSDAWSRGRLNLLLRVENLSQLSILSALMPDKNDTRLLGLLDSARDAHGQPARVLRLGAHLTSPQAVPSLLAGEVVNHVVAVLVADANAELSDDEVTDLTSGIPAEERSQKTATHLH